MQVRGAKRELAKKKVNPLPLKYLSSQHQSIGSVLSVIHSFRIKNTVTPSIMPLIGDEVMISTGEPTNPI